jgi:hypothetical protein
MNVNVNVTHAGWLKLEAAVVVLHKVAGMSSNFSYLVNWLGDRDRDHYVPLAICSRSRSWSTKIYLSPIHVDGKQSL